MQDAGKRTNKAICIRHAYPRLCFESDLYMRVQWLTAAMADSWKAETKLTSMTKLL